VLRVAKLRGSDFLTGDHSYRISAAGLDVFPRLADPVDVESFDLSAHKVGSGVGILDEMLGDGFWKGSSTLVVGPSGGGKTVLGLHFLFAGADRGERGVLASFQEDPAQLERICRGFGWSTGDEGVDVVYRSPIDLEIDEWVYDLLERVERTSADRLAIDSLAELERSAQDEIRFREYLYSLLQRLSRMGVSVMMTLGTPDYYDVNRLSHSGLSPIADNVVLLQFEREDSRIGRSITVLKTTAAVHNAMVRRYQITAEGFRLDGAAASGS
jgi:circadian clock protein KaiC